MIYTTEIIKRLVKMFLKGENIGDDYYMMTPAERSEFLYHFEVMSNGRDR